LNNSATVTITQFLRHGLRVVTEIVGLCPINTAY
jgi:hypothetical protein